MTKKLTVVVSRGRGESSSREQMERELTTALGDWPHLDVVVVPHLYDLAPSGPGMRWLRSIAGDMIVLSGLYPRAAFWVLHANLIEGRFGATTPEADEGPDTAADDVSERTIWCLDLREVDTVDAALAEIERIAAESTGQATVTLGKEALPAGTVDLPEETVTRWYPVIDYDRCGNCLECLNFCLFGVFALDDADRLVVEQPDACRDGCPACSRVCPAQAIIFPRHNSPAIAGDAEASADGFNMDLVQMLGVVSTCELVDGKPRPPEAKDDLDQLVDEFDELDL